MKKKQPGKIPFRRYWVYGPTFHKKEERYFYFLVPRAKKSTLKRSTISVARYKMCVKLGKRLPKNKHVDHINEDKVDDRMINLQILSQGDNIRKSNPQTFIKLKCTYCKKKFLRRKGNEPTPNNPKKPYCSRQCVGKASSRSFLGR